MKYRLYYEIGRKDFVIIIYGAGDMGKATYHWLKKYDKNIKNFIDRSEKLCGKSIEGIIIKFPEQIKEEDRKDVEVLVAVTARPYTELKSYLEKLGYKKIFPAGDYIKQLDPMLNLANIWNFTTEKEYQECIKNVIEYLDDNDSKEQFAYVAKWFWNRDDSAFDKKINRDKYFPDFILKMLNDEEIYLDLAFVSEEYLQKIKNNTYKKYYAFILTPIDEGNHNGIEVIKEDVGEKTEKKLVLREGLMYPYITTNEYEIQYTSIDEKIGDHPFSFLRGYSMDPILPIIKGGINSIKLHRPIMAFNIGHYLSDFKDTVLYLNKQLNDYKFKFRIHSYQGNDSILYAIPKERII